MSERLGAPPSAISGRAGPGTRAPVRVGAPPGGRSLESFSPKIASPKPKSPSFESVRPLNINKVPNRIPSINKESSPVPIPTFKQLTPDLKPQIKATQKTEIPKAFKDAFKENSPTPKSIIPNEPNRGSQRFNALGQTREYRVNRSINPLEKRVAKSEVAKMQKVENPSQSMPKGEVPKAFQTAFTNTPESALNLPKSKVPEAFQKSFEGTPEAALDPTKAVVPKSFIDAFPDGAVLDPSIPKPAPVEVSINKFDAGAIKSSLEVQVNPNLVIPEKVEILSAEAEAAKEIAKRNVLPKGSERFKKSAALIAKLQAQKAVNNEKKSEPKIAAPIQIDEIKTATNEFVAPVTELAKKIDTVPTEAKVADEISTMPTETKRQLVTKLLKDQIVSLPEAVLKENVGPDKSQNTRRELVRSLMSNNSISLNEALKQTETKLAADKNGLNAPTKSDHLKLMLATNNLGLIDAFKKAPNTETSDLKTIIAEVAQQKNGEELSEGVVGSLDALNRNIDQLRMADLLTDKAPIPIRNIATVVEAVKQIHETGNGEPKPTINPTVLEQITGENNVIDLSKARELLRQNDQQKASATVETPQQAISIINIEGNEPIKKSNPELQAKAVQLSETLLNPDQKVVIPAEKRTELVETLTELGKTTQYKESPTLQQAVTVLLKEQTEQIIEEQQVANTVQSMVEAGIEPEVIQAQITPVVEQKQLGLDPEQLNQMIEKALIRIQTQTEQQMIDEEDLDEYELLLRQIRMLYIELDDVAMQHRIETSLKALEQAFEKAYEEGRETITGSEIYSLIPKEEPSAEKSELIKMLHIDRNDGSRVEYTETINTDAEFDSPAKAYEFVMSALFANRPGRVRENPTNPLLSQAEIEKIYREKSYPTQKVVGFQQPVALYTTTLNQQAA